MNAYSYGTSNSGESPIQGEPLLFELRQNGYCVIPDVLDNEELELARGKLDAVYKKQELELGREALMKINELNLARLPLSYDPWFTKLPASPKVLQLVRSLIGDYVVLHLQNGILNMPNERHHQAAWHRDLPHQEWTITKPLAASALFCIDPFSVETGGTQVLPKSHSWERLPSNDFVESHAVSVSAAAGSVIVFDCMLFHRAGHNSSEKIRRGINHVYTIPLLRQQIDIPKSLGDQSFNDPELSQLLGYNSETPISVTDWRQRRRSRNKG